MENLTDTEYTVANALNDKVNALEILLFAKAEAMPASNLCLLLPATETELPDIVYALNKRYQTSGSYLEVRRLDNSYILTNQARSKTLLSALFADNLNPRLSKQAYEVLAAVSYNQPCTRAQIELIRGVNSDSVINNLVELGLLEKNGFLELPGHPALYVVTVKFLRLFGLSSTADLPAQPLLMYDSLRQLNEEASAAGIET